jgi:hypothetical protein
MKKVIAVGLAMLAGVVIGMSHGYAQEAAPEICWNNNTRSGNYTANDGRPVIGLEVEWDFTCGDHSIVNTRIVNPPGLAISDCDECATKIAEWQREPPPAFDPPQR